MTRSDEVTNMDGSHNHTVLCVCVYVCGINVDKVILAALTSVNIFHMQRRADL
jgi:hypothetical protein